MPVLPLSLRGNNASMNYDEAFRVALEARSRAYAPYSGFYVGAALKLEGVNEPVPGCNVENASYGGTICAERSAVVSAVSRYGKRSFEYILVLTGTTPASQPCAFCLGVLAEFAGPGLPIILANEKGIDRVGKLGDFLPTTFKL